MDDKIEVKIKAIGFRKGHSTEYAILETLENLKSAVYDEKGGIFLDFSKVFDTINHNRLENYNIYI